MPGRGLRKRGQAYFGRATRMVLREHREPPRLWPASMLFALEREPDPIAPHVVMMVRLNAWVPAVACELVVGRGHELFSLTLVLADEHDERGLAQIGQ
jgi:hypothetical protein